MTGQEPSGGSPSQPVYDGLTRGDVRIIAGAVAAAVAPSTGLTRVQSSVLNSMCEFLLGVPVDLATVEHVSPEAFAQATRGFDPRLVHRIVQAMLVGELLLLPLPADVCERVEGYADALGVADETLTAARDIAQGSLGMAMIDLERGGYFERHGDPATLGLPDMPTLVWQRDWDNPQLGRRWHALAECAEGSLGLSVWRFYAARGFTFPGTPHSAPPALAHHDWVHVLADYGSTVESEIEVFGLIGRANPDTRGFSLLAMVLSLFETGSIAEGASGFFERDAGHISRDADRMGIRLGDAMARGKHLADTLEADGRAQDGDLLGVDWFAHAERRVDDVRADFCFPEKSPRAVTAGSVGPWDRGGISAYQVDLGQREAQQSNRVYESWGATPADSSY